MKLRYWVLPLMLLQSAFAEKVESTDLKFSANVPVKMQMSKASNSSGKIVNFEGKDAGAGLSYLIQVDQNNEVAKSLADKPESLRPTLEKHLNAYSSSVKAKGEAVKTEWKKGFSKDVVFFNFEATGYSAAGDATFHTGVKFVHNGSIFTIQVVSPVDKADEASKVFLEVMKSFVLLDGAGATAAPKK
ncbi:hypothetical protein [Haloferula sp. BvORR071]|uniref:hypothetical protein n=1 Tax=Haloferula sp. BvORR071 TaxID=1396141 RepID=UPI000557AE1B|nr:hypothetical protein [Haloferula sp. BvORR071]